MIGGKLSYLNRLYSRAQWRTVEYSDHLEGASPPSVFIGRHGYPKVFVGPLMTATHGDVSEFDTPELWIRNKTAADIINFRMQLVRGKYPVKIKGEASSAAQTVREMALAEKQLDVEAEFTKRPRGRFVHEDVQPFGPSAPLKEFTVGNFRMNQRMEKAYHDTDLLARDAVLYLYHKGLYVSAIQKAFSTGAFGMAKNRRFVPTRWSITAVDDTLSKHLLVQIRNYPTIDEYRVYETEHLNNKFVVICMPTHWQYETMEAFFPQVIGDHLELYSDCEGYGGKKEYAQIGGCYYAARLAVAEQLEREQRQAGAVVLRECYAGYVPLGVFNVRENMRDAMSSTPLQFESLHQALAHAGTRLRVPVQRWIRNSTLLRSLFVQKKVYDFLN